MQKWKIINKFLFGRLQTRPFANRFEATRLKRKSENVEEGKLKLLARFPGTLFEEVNVFGAYCVLVYNDGFFHSFLFSKILELLLSGG